jgi:hypothetical protein
MGDVLVDAATKHGKLMAGPPHPVDRPLREGDEVAGFSVLETPGHTAGQVAFCFGHGPPLRDPGKFAAFVDALPG